MSLSISTETKDEATVVHVGGDLDVYTAPRLKETLDKAMSRAAAWSWTSLEVQFIDSTALGVLVSALEHCQAPRATSGWSWTIPSFSRSSA